MYSKQRGNILFLILLAVILFAALSYAVTQSLRGGGNNASEESVRVQAASIVQFLDQLDVAVLRMQMSKNIPITNISFRHDSKLYGTGAIIPNYADNANCTTDSCRVFKPDGGGAIVQNFEKAATADPSYFTSGSSLQPGWFVMVVMQWPYAKTDANDIVLQMAALKPDVCAEINRQLSISATPTTTGSWLPATDPLTWNNPGLTVNTNASSVIGKNTFTSNIVGTGSGQSCELFHLVIAR